MLLCLLMKRFFNHAGTYILRGFLAIIPLLLCATAVWLLYHFIDKQVMRFLSQFIDIRQIPGLGIVLLLIRLLIILRTDILLLRLFRRRRIEKRQLRRILLIVGSLRVRWRRKDCVIPNYGKEKEQVKQYRADNG